MIDDHITLESNELIYYNRRAKSYLDRLICIYGSIVSGKTSTALKIINFIKEEYLNTPVFTSTYNIDLEKIKEIWEIQRRRTSMYNLVNDLVGLQKLFNKVASKCDICISRKTINVCNKIDLINKSSLDINRKNELKQNIRMERDSCKKYYVL